MADDNKYSLLSKIEYPEDLRKLKIDELPQVCEELRSDIIDEVSMNPGHFASSLGVVEITVALHYVFNTPEDRLVWDVGHQAYGHKILTGRRESFCTNRKLHGIRPFPSPLESQYDTFACGHASNSISAALGMAVAAKIEGKNRHVVAIIGDGAMSGGLAFEGLNNVSSTDNDLLIILNDNDMSIDRAVGGMEKYLLNLDTNETYNRLRFKASQWLHSKGYLNDNRRKGIIRLNNALKSALSHQQNIFEGMNIRYFGPFYTCTPLRARGTSLLKRVQQYGMLLANSTLKLVSVSSTMAHLSHQDIRMYSDTPCSRWLRRTSRLLALHLPCLQDVL